MKWIALFSLMALLVTACAAPKPAEPQVLRVMTHDSFSISEEVITAFEAEHNVTVQFLKAGDTGTMLNQAILSKENPQADVIYGIDNTFLSRALEADIALPLSQLPLDDIPENLRIDPENRFFPVDYGDVCLNYDKDAFESTGLAVPQSLTALTLPEYKGLLVVQNPASSSPGLAFLIATIEEFGEDGYLDYWRALRANDVLVVDGWDTAYYTEFSGGAYSEGTRPLVVSYASSPAAEVYFSEGALTEPPTSAITTPGMCFRQIEFVAVLRNGESPKLAQAFVAFALSETFQADIPLQMWVYPTNQAVALPQVFQDHAQPAQYTREVLHPVDIEQNRERWIQEWTEAVLR